MLDYVALGVIVFLGIGATAGIVFLGSLPGSIARKRNHPWPTAVNVASWIGLATGVLWPLALIWAFLPVPAPSGDSAASDSKQDKGDLDRFQQKIDTLETKLERLLSKSTEGES